MLPFLAQDVIQTMKQSDIALGALPRLVGELVSGFADVFCDKAVAHWLEKDENLTSDELIARSEASKAHLRAAPMFVKSIRSRLLSVDIQKVIINTRMGRVLGQEEEHSIDWRDLESRDVPELGTIRAKAKDVIKKEREIKEGKRAGERGQIK